MVHREDIVVHVKSPWLTECKGLMYHPHIRPVSTLPAFLLSLSAGLAETLPLANPFASKSAMAGALDALRTHPLHVDHVAEAVLRCIEDDQKQGVVDVDTMRRWAGFTRSGVETGPEVQS